MALVIHENESLFQFWEKRRSVDAPRALSSTTSKKARAKISTKEDTQAGQILRYIQSCGSAGATDFEGMRDLLHIIPTINNSYRARRGKLAKAGLIRLASFTRTSPNGCECDVWCAVGDNSNANGSRGEDGVLPRPA